MIVAVAPWSRLAPGLALGLLVFVLPACGGSEEAGSTTSEGATTVAESTRLSAASWDQYVQARDEGQAVNEKAIDQFQVCKRLAVTYTDTGSSEVTACVNKAATPVVTGGKALLQSLTALEAEVSGQCLTTLQALEETVTAYVATVQSLQTAVANGVDSTQLAPAVDDAKQVLASGRQERVAFEAACKPLS
jgi:sarcosine oxidase delta subunit